MQHIKQDDYDNFKCIGGVCPASCCKGWQIVIDDDSLDRYEADESEFGSCLRDSIDWEEGTFLQQQGRCLMLNDEGLCKLQLAEGEDALCYTCRQYPRHIEEFENVREYSLSISCPEVARVLTTRQEPLLFITSETDEEEEFEEFDYLLYTQLLEAREVLFSVVRDRKKPFLLRCEQVLELAAGLQDCIEEDCVGDMQEVLGQLKAEQHADCDKSNYMNADTIRQDFSFLYTLEHLVEDFPVRLDQIFDSLLADPSGREKLETCLQEWEDSVCAEQLLITLLFTYFCGAVYDDMIYSKVALCVYMVLWMYMMHWSGEVELEEAIYTVAREIEHSDDNLNALEDFFYKRYLNRET